MPRIFERALSGVLTGAITVLGFSSPTRAQESSSPEPSSEMTSMTLPDAVAYARAHQPEVRAALARVAADRAEASVPRAQWLPTLGATAQVFAATANNTTGTYVSTDSMDIPRIGATRAVSTGPWQPYASTLVGIGGRQEVFDFGRIAAQAAAADARVDVDRASAEAERLDIAFDVEEAYFAVYAAKAIVVASEDAFSRASAHRELARAGVGAGMRSPIELTRAEADLARFDTGRIKARGSLAVARTVLAAAVGVPDESLDVKGPPPPLAGLPSLPDAMRAAAAHDPRVLRAMAELKAEEAKTRAVSAERRPDLSLTATVSGRAGGATPSGTGTLPEGNGWVPSVANWDIGLVFSWPIFDGTVDARVRASRTAEDVRREEIALATQKEVAAIRIAYGGVKVAAATLPGLERAVEAARANYAQAEARFRAGMGTSVELADAEALRTDAEIQAALGKFELARARSTFGRAIAEGL